MDAVGLRDAIGESKGKLTLLQHFQRTDLIFRSVPDHIWPSTGELDGSHKGRAAAIVGGGPSLTQSFPELRKLHGGGNIAGCASRSSRHMAFLSIHRLTFLIICGLTKTFHICSGRY